MKQFLFSEYLYQGVTGVFDEGAIYRRRELHDRFGGQQQSGISTPRNGSYIFLFTGSSGELYGYKDGWQADGTYRYTGQGQIGDMTFSLGNKAIRDHQVNGKQLLLFQRKEKSFVEYIGEFEYLDHTLINDIPDRNGRLRTAIIFTLRQI